ncbi:MAG: bifunctional adenosylcobinamide kinase/adenosylcobinamide-phosphate guanylyltransferase [Nitrospirae bacterium]|nr:bifunctional adenosylcobinamide kinase/adenosylcobinamide-phosphate guanylyltransferase [Nitrospirota bacterium]
MKITFVIGGARSGKSSFAMKEAEKISGPKAYIATAQALDDEMKERIRKHKDGRGADWDTFEEPLNVADLISEISSKYGVIILDCLTLWVSNLMIRIQNTEYRTQTEDKDIGILFETLQKINHPLHITHNVSRIFIVSNEVGMGIVPENEMARRFRDLAGMLNQKIAETADEVYLVTAGIPIKIKSEK